MLNRLKQQLPIFRRGAGYVLAALVLFFLGRALYQNQSELVAQKISFQIDGGWLALSVVLQVVGLSLSVETWRRLLAEMDGRIAFRDAFRIWWFSNLTRYIPGNIWQPATMAVLGEREGVPKSKTLLSQALFILLTLSLAGVLSISLVPIDANLKFGLTIFFAVATLFFALPPFFRFVLRLLARVMHYAPMQASTTFWRGLLPLGVAATMWLAYGLSFYTFVRALGIDAVTWQVAVPLYAGAYLIGYVSLLTPSGLGIREGTIAFLLGVYLPSSIAIAVALLARLLAIVGELVCVAIAWLSTRLVISTSREAFGEEKSLADENEISRGVYTEHCQRARNDTRVAIWLAWLLFGIYLLVFSGRFHATDGMLMFSLTDSTVKRADFTTDQMWTLYKARGELGPDGEAYSKTGYGTSLFAIPLYVLAFVMPKLGLAQTTMLTGTLAIALSAAILYLTARRLNYSAGVSAIVALLFGLATPAFVYAKQFWSEPISLLTLFGAFYFLLCYRDSARDRDVVLAGILLGLAVATRLTNAALVPFFLWYGFASAIRDARVRRGLIIFTAILALFALSIAWYNWTRYGNPISSGYRADEGFTSPLLLGLYGLLFSPGKGLFLYAPILAVLPYTLIVFFQRARREFFLSIVITATYLLTFAPWYIWWGGTAWSPRFLVPTLPFLMLLTAPAIDFVLHGNHRTRGAFAIVVMLLGLAGIAVQIIGTLLPPLTYHLRMTRLSANAEFDAIFQPLYSPILGYLNALKSTNIDLAWWHIVDGETQIDWLVVAFIVAFILFCVAMLVQAFRKIDPRKIRDIAIVLPIVLVFFSLYRFSDDARWDGSAGYRALLDTLQKESHGDEVMILNDDSLTPFCVNENRAQLRWYGLSRDPKQWDTATRELMARLAREYPHIWLAYDDSSESLPNPVREWLEQSQFAVRHYDFDDGVHLVLFDTRDRLQ